MRSKTGYTVNNHEKAGIPENPSVGRRLSRPFRFVSIAVLLILAATALAIAGGSSPFVPRFQEFSDPDGRFANLNLGGPTDTTDNPFFPGPWYQWPPLCDLPPAQ